ncbi:MAG: NFACT RNA binding domain-containing protein [Oligoflexia bacterium]|nr:NFACT RNA binding domain-containing protein [Oligoflexia bacterium]
MSLKPLNWKEIAIVASSFRSEIEGLFVDRIIVPERERFTAGYLKGEWVIRLTGRRNEGTFLFSVRTRHPYFAYIPGKGAKASSRATRSAFDLELNKRLKGAKIRSFEALPRERTIILWLDGDLGLVLNLIPATPEALLIRGAPDEGQGPYPILIRSRLGREQQTQFTPPDGSQAPPEPPVRENLANYVRELERELDREAFTSRLTVAQRELRDLLKQCRERIRQTRIALREAEGDENWRLYGDLLKAVLHEAPALEAQGKTWVRRVQNFANGEWVSIPADPKLGPSEQVEKYYQLARRRDRRMVEARARLESLSETEGRLDRLLAEEPEPGDFKALEKLERAAGAGAPSGAGPGAIRPSKKGAWLGKTFTSKDGLPILVGKSKDENLELTFKHARGNDVWMHVRGRPGAHVLIPLQPGKSAPLETLLDGAALAIYYSGGESWGKTEVDYTFKKFVKRIKDSSEASYTHNRTLILEPEKARLKRLLAKD